MTTPPSAPPPPSYDEATHSIPPPYPSTQPQPAWGHEQTPSGITYPPAQPSGYAQPQPGITYSPAQPGGCAQNQPSMSYVQPQVVGYYGGPLSHAASSYTAVTIQPMRQNQTFGEKFSVSPIDNFWYTVFVTLMCCSAWPLGLVAIFYGNEARKARIAEDYVLATYLGKRAGILGHLTVAMGLLIYICIYMLKR